jgi:hypothetical protein
VNEDRIQDTYQQAQALYHAGKYEESLVLFESLAQEHADSKHILYGRGVCLLALGRIDEAHELRDRLAVHRSKTGKALTAKLDEKLRARTKLPKDGQSVGQPAPHLEHADIVFFPASEEREDHARKKPRMLVAAVVCIAVVLVLGAIALIVRARSATSAPADNTPHGLFVRLAPGRYLEAPRLYPAGADKPMRFAVLLDATGTQSASTASEKAGDCAGAAVAANWETLRIRAEKALALSGRTSADIEGAARASMARTAIIPLEGLPVVGLFAAEGLQTFTPVSQGAVATVIASCGEPDRVESWPDDVRVLGLVGKMHWWGRVGLATDDQGAVIYLLLRAFSSETK